MSPSPAPAPPPPLYSWPRARRQNRPDALIHLNDIEKSFGPQTIFEGLDWHLKAGQRVGLIGPNGAGKSTLVRLVCGQLTPDGGTVRIARGTTLGYLPQEVATLSGSTVREEARKGLAEVLEVAARLREVETQLESASPAETEALMETYGTLQARFEQLDGFAAEARVDEVLCGLGFSTGELDRDCGELSGGWQMRVVLARLLLQRPDVLLLDEPTNHLDLRSVVWLEDFLVHFPGSLVFISHDRVFLDRLASHIAELAAGTLRVYTGNFAAYLRQAEERRVQLERQAKNQGRRVAELERFITRFRAKATKAKQVQSRVKQLQKMDRVELERAERTIHFTLPEPPKSGRVVLELSNAQVGYGENVIYRRLDIELVRGRRLALVGPNGAGKSTLLKVLAGAIPLQRGRREIGFQARLYYFAQHQLEVLDLKNTALQEASEGIDGLSPTRIRSILGAFLFGADDVDKPVGVLSGGEKNRLALVKMLMAPANVLLLDEPTNHLDMASRAVLCEALASYGGTIVLISHDRHFIDAVCDEVWEVEGGRVTPFPGGYTDYEKRVARGDRPEPLPLHVDLGARPAKARQAKKRKRPPTEVPVVAPPAKIDWGAGGGVRRRKSKEEKRAEAEARRSLEQRTRGLRAAVAASEAKAAELEARLEKLRGEQADPAHYQQPERVRQVAVLVAAAEKGLAAAYADWETGAAALEEAEA